MSQVAVGSIITAGSSGRGTTYLPTRERRCQRTYLVRASIYVLLVLLLVMSMRFGAVFRYPLSKQQQQQATDVASDDRARISLRVASARCEDVRNEHVARVRSRLPHARRDPP